MLSRLPRKKFANFIMVSGSKSCAENLLKKSIKNLIKSNKKQLKKLIYLSINFCLPTFKIETKKVVNKRQKTTQLRPSLINTNSYRAFFALKMISTISNKNRKKGCFTQNLKEEFISVLFPNNNALSKTNKTQEEILANQSVLMFYRWFV